METIRVSYEHKCDFVDFVRCQNKPDILGMCERIDGTTSFVDIYIKENSLQAVSEVVSDYIAGPYRNYLALNYLRENHPYISDKEAYGIVSALDVFKSQQLHNQVAEHLKTNDRMDIPGFVRFRLPAFRRDMIVDTEQAADAFFKEEEFEQMVSLLKNLVKSIPPDEKSPHDLNIIFMGNNECKVFDETRVVYDISAPEMLAGFLVELVPQKIKLHNCHLADMDLIVLLKNVFDEKVSICKGCSLCQN